MSNPNPHNGHRNRMREKIAEAGLENFQPHEILEFLLFHTVPRKDTNPMAHRLISAFGSFENVLDATTDELMEKGGLNFNSAVLVSSLKDIFTHYTKTKQSKTPINTTAKMAEVFKPFFVTQTTEKLVAAFFDSGLRLKAVKEFGQGQENGFHVNTKEILREAITFNAYNVAIAHNHPVSAALPSKNDINTTNDMKNQLEYFEIKLIDHIIFGTDGYFSFAGDEKLSCFVSYSGGSK